MTPEIAIGCTVLVAALAVVGSLAVWSCRTIERIADKQLQSAREIVQELEGRDEDQA